MYYSAPKRIRLGEIASKNTRVGNVAIVPPVSTSDNAATSHITAQDQLVYRNNNYYNAFLDITVPLTNIDSSEYEKYRTLSTVIVQPHVSLTFDYKYMKDNNVFSLFNKALSNLEIFDSVPNFKVHRLSISTQRSRPNSITYNSIVGIIKINDGSIVISMQNSNLRILVGISNTYFVNYLTSLNMRDRLTVERNLRERHEMPGMDTATLLERSSNEYIESLKKLLTFLIFTFSDSEINLIN